MTAFGAKNDTRREAVAEALGGLECATVRPCLYSSGNGCDNHRYKCVKNKMHPDLELLRDVSWNASASSSSPTSTSTLTPTPTPTPAPAPALTRELVRASWSAQF